MTSFAWEYFCELTRVLAVTLFAVGMVAVILQVPWPMVLLLIAVGAGYSRRWRGSTSQTGRGSNDLEESDMPAWLDDARWYFSEIGEESTEPVSVFDATGRDQASSESPGTLCLRLEPRFRTSSLVRVLDAGGREEGIIRSEGLIPGVRYAMRRNGDLVWRLSVRSIVRKRHVLELTNGDSWTFDTPFFWWQNLTGFADGAPRLKGGLTVVPTKTLWAMYIEPGRDTFDLLAAVAFMHRQWWHW